MSTKQLFGSIGLENMRRNSIAATRFSMSCDVGGGAVQAVVVVFRLRHLEQLARIAEVLLDLAEAEHDAFQHLALAAQFLRALGVLPDGRVFGEFDDFGQAFLLGIEVKDTSAILRCADARSCSWLERALSCSASMMCLCRLLKRARL